MKEGMVIFEELTAVRISIVFLRATASRCGLVAGYKLLGLRYVLPALSRSKLAKLRRYFALKMGAAFRPEG
jgi:hypothetical protein